MPLVAVKNGSSSDGVTLAGQSFPLGPR